MNARTNTSNGSLFFRRSVSVYALCTMLALPAMGQNSGNTGNAEPPKDVAVSDYGTVDISVQDTDLATVLQMLSIESKKNIITSKSVNATVSANLYDVTLHEALRSILEVNGFTFYEQGNFIYVITRQEEAEMRKAARRAQSRIFTLNYLSPTDANEFIQPLLSEEGKASARGAVQPGMKPDVGNNGADDYAFTPQIVVYDYAENLDAIAALLAELDTPPQQVLVEATILQTALNEDNAFGIDFTILGSLDFTDLTNPLAAVNNLIAGGDATKGFQPADNKAQAVTSNVGKTDQAGGLKVGIISDDISVFLRVLDEVTDTSVLARPKVMALNRQRAEVHVGTKVGYLSTTSTETTTTQNVQFLDTGVQLIFRPFITNEGMIRLELKPSVSDFRLRDVTDSTGNTVTIPDELTNQVLTNVRVKDGQTLVLGGLFKERFQTTRRQVPLLGDVPLLGAAFRGQDDQVQRSEIIFLITPSIVKDSTLWAMGEDQMADVDRLRVGARAQLLPFSREKVTANYNQRAQDAMDKGDSKQALYYVNASLNLAPNQPEMIRMREQITGERAATHERSLMERATRRGLGLPEQTSSTTNSGTQPVVSTASETESSEQFTAGPSSSTSTKSTTGESTTAVAEATTDDLAMNSQSTQPTATSLPSTKITEMMMATAAASPHTTKSTPSTAVSAAPKNPLTPEQIEFYREILWEYFAKLNMPEYAAIFREAESQLATADAMEIENTGKSNPAPTKTTAQSKSEPVMLSRAELLKQQATSKSSQGTLKFPATALAETATTSSEVANVGTDSDIPKH